MLTEGMYNRVIGRLCPDHLQLIIIFCHLPAYNHKIVSKKLRKFENYKEKTMKVRKLLEQNLECSKI